MARALWISVDPRSGEVSAYPSEATQRLEQEYATGRSQRVSLDGLVPRLDGVFVELGREGCNPVQRTTRGGRRDVRRLEVAHGNTDVKVYVAREGDKWRIADFSAPGVTEERSVRLEANGPMAVRIASADANTAHVNGLVGLWEWCTEPILHDVDSLPALYWAMYGEAHNRAIEDAYLKGDLTASVSIGVRTFDIIFEGPQAMRQIDHALNRHRAVRRRLITMEERDSALQTPLGESNEGECSVCCEDFAATPCMPVVTLPDCGHTFHGACVRQLADEKKCCPMCRRKANWREAFAQ